jgi:hypothetical protein
MCSSFIYLESGNHVLEKADLVNHVLRLTDSVRRFNLVPYLAQYFGHKLRVGSNEKLVHYRCY